MFRNIVLLVLVSCLGAQLAAAEPYVYKLGVDPPRSLQPEIYAGTTTDMRLSIQINYLACKAPYVLLVVDTPILPSVKIVGLSLIIEYNYPTSFTYAVIAKTPSCGV